MNKLYYLTICMSMVLFSACNKEDEKPLPNQTNNNLVKTTGTLIVKYSVDPQKWNEVSGEKYLHLIKLNGGGGASEIILIRGMIVENQKTYNLGEWNSGEYKLEGSFISGGSTPHPGLNSTFQIQANKTIEFIIE